MKLVLLIISLLSLGAEVVTAFSTANGINAVPKLEREIQDLVRRVLEKRLLVNPLTTPIDVSGDHAFIAPNFEVGDQRGPCPGLNALANHGYIGRNGVTSLLEATTAINEVYGMGLDLAAALAVMGTVFVGDPLSLDPGFSIGGETAAVENILGNALGLLGTPRGLFGSHNIIEGDSSNTRNDLYLTGDAWTLQMDQFMAWYNMSTDPVGDYNMDLMAERANIRFQESVAGNPYFYYGPFTGMVARNAGFIFAGRLFANHSSENPVGVLTKETVKSFFAISGEEGNLTYNYGWETIPQNWYKTPVDYGLVQLNLDIVSWTLKYPQLGAIGGNTGTVNSFAGLDLGNLTGGIFEAGTLLENNNLLCFAFEVVKLLAPNSLSTLFSVLDVPLQMITDTLGSALLNFTCPALTDLTLGGQGFEEDLESMFPGVAKSGSAF
ncbi:related to oxidase [Phialocephala subalpina]|uniref:Related to oxidase n=1 Tax=Phialocephala subalpina TaxID=576137 RepID=A0A1L7XUT9_9HELO|nr:related to oxidase [Phialocephala subalpina]